MLSRNALKIIRKIHKKNHNRVSYTHLGKFLDEGRSLIPYMKQGDKIKESNNLTLDIIKKDRFYHNEDKLTKLFDKDRKNGIKQIDIRLLLKLPYVKYSDK